MKLRAAQKRPFRLKKLGVSLGATTRKAFIDMALCVEVAKEMTIFMSANRGILVHLAAIMGANWLINGDSPVGRPEKTRFGCVAPCVE